MDKNLASQEIQILEIAQGLVSPTTDYKKLNSAQISFLSRAYEIFQNYTSKIPGQITDVFSFAHFISYKPAIYSQLIAKIKNESGIKEVEIKKETSSVPVELETMVALYKEHQADLLDSDSGIHTVADTIKRARKSWSEREKIRLIYENAEKERQEKVDQYYQKTVDPKKDSREEINKNSYKLAEIAILAQGTKLTTKQLANAIDNLVYLAETGAIEIDNYNELNVASALAVKDQVSIQTEFDQLDKLIQEKQKQQDIDPDSEEPNKLNGEIILANQEAENTFRSHSKNFRNQMERVNQDYDVFVPEAKKEIEKVIIGLSNAIPNAKLQFQAPEISSQKIAELESLIRKVDPTALNTNPSGLGARASETVRVMGGNMAAAIDRYSKGLNKEKLEELSKKQTKEGEVLRKFLEDNRSLHKNIERGLKKVQNSTLGKELDGAYKKVNYLIDPIGAGRTYINKQIGKYAGEQIKNHFGEAVGKKFEKYLLSDGLKLGAKKFADEVAKKILVAAAKKAGVEAGKVAAMAAGESALAAASVALGVSTAGLSLIIEAAALLITIQYNLLKKGFSELKKNLGITEEDDKENKKALLVGLGALAATAFAVNRGAKIFGTATKAAVISAVGIIWLSLATIAVFLTFTFLTAPILTTLVQFDSMEKVRYGEIPVASNSSCAWPISGKYQVIEGPLGGTHSLSSLQAIDIWGPDINGKSLLSPVDGTVSFKGDYSNYGNSVKIETSNSAGKFTVIFGHMSGISVSVGQQVKQGDKLGLVDSSALFQTPHIHMEYVGIDYNQCPAGGKPVKEHCINFTDCGSIYTE